MDIYEETARIAWLQGKIAHPDPALYRRYAFRRALWRCMKSARSDGAWSRVRALEAILDDPAWPSEGTVE